MAARAMRLPPNAPGAGSPGCTAPLTVAVTHEMMSRAIQGAYASLSPAETLARSHPQDRLYRLDGGAITEMIIA